MIKVTVTELTQLHRCERQISFDTSRGPKRSVGWKKAQVDGVKAHERLERLAKGQRSAAPHVVASAILALLRIIFRTAIFLSGLGLLLRFLRSMRQGEFDKGEEK